MNLFGLVWLREKKIVDLTKSKWVFHFQHTLRRESGEWWIGCDLKL